MKVAFFKHNVGEKERAAVDGVLQSLFLTTGADVDAFEKALARYLGTKHAIGLMSCTSALHLALLAAGVGEGDEVITTPMSFVASSNVILMTGAKPVFVDVESHTGNINADLIEKAITKRTKAILPVHLYGQMVDMKKILSIAKRNKLIVIEDAAHALEAKRDGIRPGEKSFGACFSFYATKGITSGEGGAFATQSDDVAALMRQLRSHGITSELAQRERTGLKTYDINVAGWKANMNNIQGAMLLPQLRKADSTRAKREAVAKKYRAGFKNLAIQMPEALRGAIHGYHLFPIWVEAKKRDAVLAYLNTHGVGAVINYPPIHLFTLYKKKFGFKTRDFPIAEKIAGSTVSLPMYAKLKKNEVDYVIKIVKEALERT